VTRQIRTFLLLEAAAFATAALVHFGVLLDGYEHDEARIAESVIAVVLLAGFALSWFRPALTREAGIAAQGFALLGTLVGLFTIAVGVGPRTALDVVYHVAIVLVLIWGLRLAVQAPAEGARQPA
jgi:hypothetical protein